MSLQFFNSGREDKPSGKSYTNPVDVMNDMYLTPEQKHIVLEAMLSELRDNDFATKQDLKRAGEILKAQAKLKNLMD